MSEFITDVTIGAGTPFTINSWNGSVERDGIHVATAVGRENDGGVTPFKTREGAENYARSLQPIRYPGEDIFVLTHRAYADGDVPVTLTYFVAGPIRVGTFDVEEN